MKLCFAPMEGISTYLYRRLHARLFGGVEEFFAPFIAPDGSGNYKASARRDILPENNRDILLIPQLLVNRPEPFISVARELSAMGYSEVNLNVGCPSATVVAKHKGAGMLMDKGGLDACLNEIFSRSPLKSTPEPARACTKVLWIFRALSLPWMAVPGLSGIMGIFFPLLHPGWPGCPGTEPKG